MRQKSARLALTAIVLTVTTVGTAQAECRCARKRSAPSYSQPQHYQMPQTYQYAPYYLAPAPRVEIAPTQPQPPRITYVPPQPPRITYVPPQPYHHVLPQPNLPQPNPQPNPKIYGPGDQVPDGSALGGKSNRYPGFYEIIGPQKRVIGLWRMN